MKTEVKDGGTMMANNCYITEEQRKLNQEILRRQLEVATFAQKEEIKKRSDLEKARYLANLREESEIRRDLQVMEILQGQTGRLEMCLTRDKMSRGKSAVVIADEFIRSVCYVTRYPQNEAVLTVTFRKQERFVQIILPLRDEESDVNRLIIKLQKAGIYLQVSRRLYTEAKLALFNFLLGEAELVEIPPKNGYILNEDGEWRLVKPGMITMRRIKNG